MNFQTRNVYLLYFDHNDDSYSRKWMRKINFFTHAILRTLSSQFCAPFLIGMYRISGSYPVIRPIFHYPVSGYPVSGL